MTILLTKPLRVGGVELASGTTQTLGASLEADVVARMGATYTTDPMVGRTVPVVATTDLTGGIKIISKLTQAQYDALGTKDDSTLYVIVG